MQDSERSLTAAGTIGAIIAAIAARRPFSRSSLARLG